MLNQLGFMQGRLSPMHNGKIQSFPHDTWEIEFRLAESLGITRIEWTLDYPIGDNPLLDTRQHSLIKSLCKRHNIRITGLTVIALCKILSGKAHTMSMKCFI